MSLLENSVVWGTACFVAGSGAGYWLWRWKERNVQAAHMLRQKAALDEARHEAETVSREARIRANEEAMQIRQTAEDSFSVRKQELAEAEKRLVERESL